MRNKGAYRLVAALASGWLWAPGAAEAATRHRPILGVATEARVDRDAVSGAGTEFMSKLSGEVGWSARNPRLDLEAAYLADLVHHAIADNFTLDHRARLLFRGAATRRLTFRAEGALYRVEDTATLPRFGVANLRAPALWATAGASASWHLTRTETVEAGYLGEVSRLYLPGLPLGAVHAGQAQLTSRFTERLEAGLRHRFQLFTADGAPFAQGHSPALRLRHRFDRHAFAEVEAGPMAFVTVGGEVAWEPRLRGEIGWESRGAGVGLLAGRDFVGAAGYATAIWADFAQLAGSWRVSRAVGLHGVAGLFRNGLAPEGPVAAQGYGLSLGAEWRLAPGLSAQAGYDRIGQFDVGGLGLGLARDIGALRLVYRMP